MPSRAKQRVTGPRQRGRQVHCAWQSLTGPGLEIVSLQRRGARLVAKGQALRIDAGSTRAITWEIECDRDWRTRAVAVWPAGVTEPMLAAECNGHGVWTILQGRVEGRIAGCVDVHLEGGPISHTLPIRRLSLTRPGEEVHLRVALADPANGTIRPARRAYRLIGQLDTGRMFHYRDLENGASGGLLVDDFGLVHDHAGLFRMVWWD